MRRFALPVLAVTLGACLPPSSSGPEQSSTTAPVVVEPVDSEPPVLDILAPNPGIMVTLAGVDFIGVTEPGATLICPDGEEEVIKDGNWRKSVRLVEGDNVVTFRARDAAGNETTVSRVVRYLPPLECSWEADVSANPDTCSYWGYIQSVNFGSGVLNFDLVSFERYGAAEWEFEIVNDSTAIRTLKVSPDAEVWACPSEDGATYSWCESPDDFVQVDRSNLNKWISQDFKFWGLHLEDEVVVRIDQWWWP